MLTQSDIRRHHSSVFCSPPFFFATPILIWNVVPPSHWNQFCPQSMGSSILSFLHPRDVMILPQIPEDMGSCSQIFYLKYSHIHIYIYIYFPKCPENCLNWSIGYPRIMMDYWWILNPKKSSQQLSFLSGHDYLTGDSPHGLGPVPHRSSSGAGRQCHQDTAAPGPR